MSRLQCHVPQNANGEVPTNRLPDPNFSKFHWSSMISAVGFLNPSKTERYMTDARSPKQNLCVHRVVFVFSDDETFIQTTNLNILNLDYIYHTVGPGSNSHLLISKKWHIFDRWLESLTATLRRTAFKIFDCLNQSPLN